MADPKGFLTHARAAKPMRDAGARVRDYAHVYTRLPLAEVRTQAARCMDCGVPFCHDACPLGNLIPDWNDLVREDRWREALDELHRTNDFPEFTGWTCPAPCEAGCVLEINDDPVMIKQVELEIIEHGFAMGWVRPAPRAERTGHRVAVVGSGPAGLAAANQLNRRGHHVVVFERDEAPGGLLRFGIPDPKLEKHVIDRRLALLEAEGVAFRCGHDMGVDIGMDEVVATFDAVVLAVGAQRHRVLSVPGAELAGVVPALRYLRGCNRVIAADGSSVADHVSARDQDVLVIGGGDTAADCIANANRERAASVSQFDRYPEPQGARARDATTWPAMPRRIAAPTYALEEGGRRHWGETVLELHGRGGHVTSATVAEVTGPPDFAAVAGTEREVPADLVLVAVGFTGPDEDEVVGAAGATLDGGLIVADAHRTANPRVFACGDARVGASLVVTAIADGRGCAVAVDRSLRGVSEPAGS